MLKKMRQSHQYRLSYSLVGKGILGMTLLLIPSSHALFAAGVANKLPAAIEATNNSLPPLPDLPPVEQDMSLSSLGDIKVEQFKFEGNVVFSDEELEKITESYKKELSAEELQQVKNEITNFYIEQGYINSGAIIRDQKVDDGIVTVSIIEGKLFRVDVSGNEKLKANYIEKRLKGEDGKPLNIKKLQERLQMLQQNPRLQRLQAELGPGVRLGEGILKIDVQEKNPHHVQFTFNNHRSPSVGAYRGEIRYWHNNLTGSLLGQGWGDTLSLRVGLTQGLKDFTFGYEFPLNHHDTTLSFHVERSDSEVVERPFSQLDVESEADTYAISLRHPLINKPKESLDLALRLEKRISNTYLLGRPFSFSPGVRDGESNLSVVRFSQQWVKRSTTDVIAARSSFNFGIDALNSTINDDGSADSKFFTWLGQFQYVKRLDFFKNIDFFKNTYLKDSQIIFRTDFQWAKEDLLPLEKLSMGGATTVRGYRENLLTRDNGVISSFEWRIPIYRLPTRWSKNPNEGWLEFTPFIDYGRSWNTDIDTPNPKSISSVGLGLRWSPNQHFHSQLYWGYALRDIPDPDDKDMQDNGIHFEMSLHYF